MRAPLALALVSLLARAEPRFVADLELANQREPNRAPGSSGWTYAMPDGAMFMLGFTARYQETQLPDRPR